MLVKTLMIIIGSISTTILMFVVLIWGGTFFESIDLSNISIVNPIDSIVEHAERTAKKMNEKMDGERKESE